jgi:type VI secretion system protein ImpM
VIPVATEEIPGWYGKLPGLGDFASRRLPDEFVRAWDEWLQQVIHATRTSLAETWVDSYLTMPIWRFALLPGLVGASGWAGVLMPSVDRVGRQFPLTLLAELRSAGAAAGAVFEAADWFAGLEDAALGVLDPTRGPDDLDRGLAACAFPSFSGNELDDSAVGTLRRLPSMDAFSLQAKAEALDAWSRHGGWKAIWWTRGRVDSDPLILTTAALPTADEFALLVRSRPAATPNPRETTAAH